MLLEGSLGSEEKGVKEKLLDRNFKVTSLAPLSEQLSKTWQQSTVGHYYVSGLPGLLHAVYIFPIAFFALWPGQDFCLG